MRRCVCCGRGVEITAESRPRTVVYADPETDAPFMHFVLWECRCQNTLSAVLWQDEECSLEEHSQIQAEMASPSELELVERCSDRATHRGFFSLTHELAARGL